MPRTGHARLADRFGRRRSPVRATFPGLACQAGNFLAAANANIQLWLAGRLGGDVSMTMGLTVAVMGLAIMVLMMCRPASPRSRILASDP